jgi:hypothetical protein
VSNRIWLLGGYIAPFAIIPLYIFPRNFTINQNYPIFGNQYQFVSTQTKILGLIERYARTIFLNFNKSVNSIQTLSCGFSRWDWLNSRREKNRQENLSITVKSQIIDVSVDWSPPFKTRVDHRGQRLFFKLPVNKTIQPNEQKKNKSPLKVQNTV